MSIAGLCAVDSSSSPKWPSALGRSACSWYPGSSAASSCFPAKTLKVLNQRSTITSWSCRSDSTARRSFASESWPGEVALHGVRPHGLLDALALGRRGRVLQHRLALAFLSLSDELLHQRAAVLTQHLESRQPLFQGRVVDSLGMELVLEEGRRADAMHALAIARPRPEGDAREQVPGRFGAREARLAREHVGNIGRE